MKHILLLIIFFQSATFLYCQNNQWINFYESDLYTCLALEGNTLWASTYDLGLIKYNTVTWSKEVFNSKNSGLPYNSIQAIAIDAAGNKWIGLRNGQGIVKFDGRSWTKYDLFTSSSIENNIFHGA
jgi:ligand-binding sensor domain-containing protein